VRSSKSKRESRQEKIRTSKVREKKGKTPERHKIRGKKNRLPEKKVVTWIELNQHQGAGSRKEVKRKYRKKFLPKRSPH